MKQLLSTQSSILKISLGHNEFFYSIMKCYIFLLNAYE